VGKPRVGARTKLGGSELGEKTNWGAAVKKRFLDPKGG